MYFWYGCFVVSLTISMALLIKATQTLPIGTAYAVWTGIGAVGTVLMGILVFKDPASFWRLFFITTLIGSVLGLQVVSNRERRGQTINAGYIFQGYPSYGYNPSAVVTSCPYGSGERHYRYKIQCYRYPA